MTNTAEFLKVGKKIIIKPTGADYNLIGGKVYDLSYERFSGEFLFSENGDLNLPKKLYTLAKDLPFRQRVLHYYKNASGQTTGVLLAGEKGTGKTVTAKLLAMESDLPIIVVDSEFPASKLNTFFKSFRTPVCVILDEVEKNFETKHMLDFLDGVQETCKKLVLMTCNDITKVSEYMQDRCSRIRYLVEYNTDENIDLISEIVKDLKIKASEEVIEFIRTKIRVLSIDNVCAFLNEVKLFEDYDFTLDDILDIMNISTKTPLSKSNVIVDDSDDDVYNECDDECDDECSFDKYSDDGYSDDEIEELLK